MQLPLPALAACLCTAGLSAQMSGAYLIDPSGAGGAFTSFTQAVNAMFVTGINGACEFAVAPGAYTESVLVPPIPGASATNSITFRSLLGPGTVLPHGGAGDTFALLGVAFQHNRSIVWDGIDFTGAAGHAISGTTFCEDMEIRNCFFASGHRSTAAGESRHCVIVSENSSSEIGWRVHHNTLTLSNYTNRTSYGIYLSNGGDWQIHHNRIDLNGGDHGLWLINNNTRVDSIYDNLFVGTLHNVSSSYANSVCAIRADISNYQNYITHNTFAVTLPASGCCIATGGYSAVQNYIYGNVFLNAGGTAIVVGTSSSTAMPFQSNGNLFFAPGGELGRIGANVAGATSLAAWQALSGKDAASVEADPLLQDPFGPVPDLRPTASSPVTGVAVNTPAYVDTDYAGRLRDGAPDAGAYESTSLALYGSGCPGTGGLVPALSATGSVALGSASFTFELNQAAPNSIALFMGGGSRTLSLLGPLPLPIGGGCTLLQSLDANLLFLTSPTGTVTVPFPLPGASTLSGLDLFFQWAIADAGSGSPIGLTTSEAGALQL
ncbi:MAG: hypothetical protein IT455_12280 [Planctomycetes bacterium]|nr:hypothetical protein [Planctomycetota bacterium]